MRQDGRDGGSSAGSSDVRPSFNSFYRSSAWRPRENQFRSGHLVSGGGGAAAISCVPIISHLESRPSLPFNPSLPFDPFRSNIPTPELFLLPRSPTIYRGATRVPVGLASLLIPIIRHRRRKR